MAENTVTAGNVIFLAYTLRDDAGEVLDTSDGGEPLLYLHGAKNIVPGLEAALDGQEIGAKLQVAVAPADGYGERNPAANQTVPREAFKDIPLQVGMQLFAESEEGHPMPFWVAEVGEAEVKVDFNHPLAGQTLNFDVEIIKSRPASAEETAHGHPHGPLGTEGHGH
jgi:FKBP-type peptidyl-prolyl cis-trans isomerase SlyD